MKNRFTILLNVFICAFAAHTAGAAPATTTAPVTPTSDCQAPVSLDGLIYKSGPDMKIDRLGNTCPGGTWKPVPVTSDNQVVFQNEDPTVDNKGVTRRSTLNGQRIAVTSENVNGARRLSDIVTVEPIRDATQATKLAGLTNQPGAWLGVIPRSQSSNGNSIAELTSFVSATHFHTDNDGKTKMVSQTQCFAGSCLNVNVDSCTAYMEKMNVELAVSKRPPVKSFAEMSVHTETCLIAADAGAKAYQANWKPKTGSNAEGEKLYEHDIETIKNSKALAAADSKNTGFKKYNPIDMSDHIKNMNNFALGCALMEAENGVRTVYGPAAPAPAPAAQRRGGSTVPAGR